METKYYVDVNGNYIGAYLGTHGVDLSNYIEVSTPPSEPGMVWSGSVWNCNKPALLAYLAEYRYNKEVNGILVSGLLVRTDDRSKSLLTGKYSKAVVENNPTKINKVKLVSGFIDLTNQQLVDIFLVIADHIQKCFDCEAAVQTLINNDTLTTKAGIGAAFDAEYNA